MLQLAIQIQTQGTTPFSPAESHFKGGLLHGLFEHALTRHQPSLWASLRGPDNQLSRYALRVPQDSDTHWPEGHVFELGIMLFAPVQHLWPEVLAALTQGPPLRIGQARSLCAVQDMRIHRPGQASLSLLQAMGHIGKALPDWTAQAPPTPASKQIDIELQAPCWISSTTRREDPDMHSSPFTLSSIVRSLQRRIQALEPALASQFQFDSPEWQHHCQSIWPYQVANTHHISPRPWPYASRNTPGQGFVTIDGIQGSMQFKGQFPAPITSLLHIGQWMGLGQKTSLGMGWYGVVWGGDRTVSLKKEISK